MRKRINTNRPVNVDRVGAEVRNKLERAKQLFKEIEVPKINEIMEAFNCEWDEAYAIRQRERAFERISLDFAKLNEEASHE